MACPARLVCRPLLLLVLVLVLVLVLLPCWCWCCSGLQRRAQVTP